MSISGHTTCLDAYLASFEQTFAARNYKPATLENYRHHLRRFGRLLEVEGIAPSELTADIAVELGRRLPTSPKSQIKVPNLATLFVEHLIEIGVATRPPLTAAQAERQELLCNLELYLLRQRGLSPRSVKHVRGFAARFLVHRFGDGGLDLAVLGARDVVAFMEHVIARKTPYRDKTLSTHLRGFFQYLFAQGLTTANLSLCVPRVHKPWGERLPRYLSPDEVEAVLASVATNPRRGARDYAMLLLMARLGIRAPEVMAIQLDDIDWRAGELLVRGKGQRHDRLPIPPDVGQAISRYLREERTSTTTRTLFVSHRAPNRPFKDSQIINSILREAFAATGVKPPTPYVGSHVLRHSLATNLVRSGASLEEIGDLLRHRSRATTMIYAKLDTDGLRSIAQPWPITEAAQ
ncbi:tyrosine-type recombinase/integrase [Agrobacterium vitis]|uniref:site-specific integrase n=2 Tax=Agrobacterium vitis TaxID=373 RepID=UPI000872DEC5|nr:site-specific integrase [Agrobacterium vitis]MCM2442534.1 tyrosine-type recombinase/integrase [Agrobacterium vitis]NSY15653.1 tyrosine-type recombinase/integrase [Agrobacterium vitis]NSY25328.1 tyrosine-type recombinase/integrase [Agrobacterium vitis]NTA24820.1 tyrosine-type recombinase/integrase [Agrobacterium vitis]WEO75583.1 site-specific integrase [Agrobacterium vitis]